jgi:hypothetical protein
MRRGKVPSICAPMKYLGLRHLERGVMSGELPLSLIFYFSLSLSWIHITSTGSISSDCDCYGHSHVM